MIIVVLAGRRYSVDNARKWLKGRGGEFTGQNNLWRLGATSPAEEYLLSDLLEAGETVEVHVPYTVASHPQSSRPLLEVLKRHSQVVEWKLKDFPYGSCYQRRNSNMLNGSRLLVAFYDQREGALEKTIKEAQVRKKKLIILKEE